MTPELTNLKELPWREQRACYTALGKESPAFRSLRRHTIFLQLLITTLMISLCYALSDQLGRLWFISPIIMSVISDWWIEHYLLLPYAVLHLKKTVEQLMDVNRP